MEQRLAKDTQTILDENDDNSSITLPDNIFSVE
jgi:hypothetical protein